MPPIRGQDSRTSEQSDITGRVSSDDIARRAYERFLRRGAKKHGRDVETGFEAERELLVLSAPLQSAILYRSGAKRDQRHKSGGISGVVGRCRA